tara:strand:+ start:983 stop:1192 length:210 start_codon:yes stop_codon:yes gene_type:complete
MKYKVHWIIDGIVDVDASSKEEAEKKIQEELEEYVKSSDKLMNVFIAKVIQGSAYLPGSNDEKENEEKN